MVFVSDVEDLGTFSIKIKIIGTGSFLFILERRMMEKDYSKYNDK